MRTNRWVVAVVGVGVVAGSWFSRGAGGPEYDGEVTVSAAKVTPGQVIEVTASDRRGSVLSLHKEGRERALFVLFGTRDRDKIPTWATPEGIAGGVFATFAVDSSEPYRVMIPPPVPNGTYSLCANGERTSCVRLKVAR